ncbi:hypothetical protein WJX74_009404 [Apatococcus lobatus]|uniref:Uncharacterized protein n=1 Tax=Apatococcus lobatus TaxID=904363 RepID=A0AAW1QIU8_9CHLO
MELDEADELNMAFSSDLQACKFVRTPDDLARLLSAADSYREELCQLSGTNQLELVQVLCRVAERLLTTGSITKDFHHLASLLRAATEHVHSVATGKHIGQFLQQVQSLARDSYEGCTETIQVIVLQCFKSSFNYYRHLGQPC